MRVRKDILRFCISSGFLFCTYQNKTRGPEEGGRGTGAVRPGKCECRGDSEPSVLEKTVTANIALPIHTAPQGGAIHSSHDGWVIVGALQWMQPEYELDEEGNIFRTLWGKKRILYTSDQIRQAVDRAKRMKRRLAWLDTLLREIEEPQQAGA